MTGKQLLDRRLDAIAFLEARMHDDEEALATLLEASDDPEHWRGVASVLVGILAAQMRHSRNPEGFIAWIRARTLAGKIGDDPWL
jgi:hypothetical protein